MKTLARVQDRTEILDRLRTLGPQSVRRWGRMSVHQMVFHLGDVLRMAIGQQPCTPATGVLQRTIVKWIALYAPIPWPRGTIRTGPEIDQVLLGTAPKDFASGIAQVVALLDHVTADPRPFDWALHPVFGRMSDAAWFRWGYLHLDHHLRQFGA